MPWGSGSRRTLRKPLSCERVKVNWEHPHNKGLLYWSLLNSAQVTDLVTGAVSASTPGAWTVNGDGSLIGSSSAVSLALNRSMVFAATDTWYVYLDYKSPSTSANIYAIVTNNGTSSVGFREESYIWVRVAGNYPTDFGPSTFVTRKRYLIKYSNGALTLWMSDGTYDTSSITAGAITFSRIGSVDTWYFGGTLYEMAIWNGQLNIDGSEGFKIVNNPYGTPSSPRLI